MNKTAMIEWRKIRLQEFAANLRDIANGVDFDLAQADDDSFSDEEMIGLAKAFLGIVDGILRDLVAHPE